MAGFKFFNVSIYISIVASIFCFYFCGHGTFEAGHKGHNFYFQYLHRKTPRSVSDVDNEAHCPASRPLLCALFVGFAPSWQHSPRQATQHSPASDWTEYPLYAKHLWFMNNYLSECCFVKLITITNCANFSHFFPSDSPGSSQSLQWVTIWQQCWLGNPSKKNYYIFSQKC